MALGASTGGTDALVEVVKRLPANTPPVLITQHMPPTFTKMFAERIDRISPMRAKEAEDGDRLEQGLIIVAAGGNQMRLYKDARGYYITSRPGEKVSGHCTSVDVLFTSVAETAGSNAIGAILTGMGADGAEGLLKMREAGAYTIGQDEETCVVYGMPGVAYKKGAVMTQLPLQKIAEHIISKVK
ncbi:MAG: chemotaxis protein CheB [Ruminiclostridium sp.]|nr:chemotaxis protein CheB [Ruminiclostridium sp.]